MTLQDQIDSFQKLIFSNFNTSLNNECRISALVPLVQESYGIYKFITSMLRAMHTGILVPNIWRMCRLIANSYFLQPPETTKHSSHSEADMMPSTTVLFGSTTSAPTCAISLVLSRFQNCHKTRPVCSARTMTVQLFPDVR